MFQVGSIVLGGVDLNNSLQWTDRYAYTNVEGTRKRTLGGGLVIFSTGLQRGQPITLVATQDTGWFTYGMVTQILALAESHQSSYVLNFHGENHNVRFDYTNRPAEFTPLIPKNQGYANDTDYFIGTVRLITV